jgi:hypothetical protein
MAEITTKEYKYHFIYKTTNLLTGKFYIGMHSTNKLEDGYLGGGDIVNFSIKKYGRKNHKREILEFLEDRNSLDCREREIVNEELLKNPLCMNLVEGGNGGFSLSPAHCKKFSDAGHEAFRKRLKEDPDFKESFGKKQGDHFKDLWAKGTFDHLDLGTFRGKKHSEEAKIRIGLANSEHQKGENNSQYGKVWVNKEKDVKKIDPSELEEYLRNEWSRGRVAEVKEKKTFWVFKDLCKKRVSEENLQHFLSGGWSKEKKFKGSLYTYFK